MAQYTVAVDFDGVIHRYEGWKGPDVLDEPNPGAREFLAELVARGFRVVILTTRPARFVEPWLRRYRMDDLVDQVTSEKVAAVAYIDDRAVRFRGNWDQVLARLGEQPWWKHAG